jgi:hypothetical protein
MATVFINNLAVVLPRRFAAGDTIGEIPARILHNIWLKRFSAKLRWLKDRGEIDAQSMQAKAEELAAQELTPYNIAEDADDDDPILVEAIEIARTLIISRMAAEGISPPKGIDTHARALVDSMPAIVEKARIRVEARHRAAALPI